MVHLGFVWPDDERVKFQNKIRDNNWPEGWFDDTSRGDESCILYMSHEFIEHCLETTDGILDGIGAYYRSLHEDELEKFTSILKNLPDVDFFNIARAQEKNDID